MDMPKTRKPVQIDPASRIGFSVDEAAAAMGLSRSKIYELMKEKRLRYSKVGDRTIISDTNIRDCLAELQVA
jgi:excisionase family DNA binding protein